MMAKLDADAGLDASARVNTRENVRLTFDQKVEHVIQEIVDSNFDLYKRITDDRSFGEAIKNFLFDQYLRAHRQAEELIKQGESKTLEFKASLRWDMRKSRQDDKVITHAVLKTVAAFLNSQGGTLYLGLDDSGAPVGIREDLALIDDDHPEDVFQNRFREFLKNSLDPMPLSNVASKFQGGDSKRVCVIEVQPFQGVTYLVYKDRSGQQREGVFVRDGNRTIELKGRARDQFVVSRS
ncbi:MAG: ATP-binding protein [Armatimonadetes bacterium]|nr:ATP-binding protein [Armatimonadota bacterium]